MPGHDKGALGKAAGAKALRELAKENNGPNTPPPTEAPTMTGIGRKAGLSIGSKGKDQKQPQSPECGSGESPA
jgi:hypothetical protein